MPIPPYAEQAEAAIVSAVLDGRLHDEIAGYGLTPEHFYLDANARIFEAFQGLVAKDLEVNILTVRDWLKERGQLQRVGGATYLAQLTENIPYLTERSLTTFVKQLLDKHQLRRVIAQCQKTMAEAYECTDDVNRFVDDFEQSIYTIAERREEKRPRVMREIVTDYYRAIQARLESGEQPGTSSGFSNLDSFMEPFAPGDLVILAARPGVGKSTLAQEIAKNIVGLSDEGFDPENKNAVAIFSLEMPSEQFGARMICSHGKLTKRSIEQPNPDYKLNQSKLMGAIGPVSKMSLWIDDESEITLAALRSKTRRIQSEARRVGKELKVVIVDYLQLMGVNQKITSREQQVSENSRGLKSLAKKMGVTIIALSQLNRGVENRSEKASKPRLSDLRESGAIEQDADKVLFIHRDMDPDSDKKESCFTEVILAKQRSGATGTAWLRYVPQYFRFEDWEGDAPQSEVRGKRAF